MLSVGVVLTGAVLLSMRPADPSHNDQIYHPRHSSAHVEADEARGAAEWMNSLRANAHTGKINPQDVLRARQQVAEMQRSMKTSALGLQWQEMGPDNIGGRTRGIYIDPDNPSFMLAGSVSGGLYRSTTGGSSWQLVDGDAPNNAITYITKTANGDFYACTGEGLHYGAFGQGSGGILGGGIYKSTDGGNSFTLLASTQPTPNNRTAEWANISFVIADPAIADRIYAGTNLGLRRSDDGGQNWVNPVVGSPSVSLSEINSGITDFTVATDGSLWVKTANQVLYSPSGDNGSFQQMSGGGSGLPANNNRARIAVSPTNPDYVYVVNVSASGGLGSVYRSTDRGASWTFMIQGSGSFNPMRAQGDYDLLLTVDPKDPERFIMGGVELWSWSTSDGWRQIHSTFASPTNPFYVHVDQHDCVFHPTNPNIVYVVNDGGIFRSSNDGFTWVPVNTNYISLQLYSVVANEQGLFMGGSQDNGTIAVVPGGNTARSGVRTPGIDYEVASESYANLDGDGGYVEASAIVPDVLFKEMQYGILGRSENGGQSFESFYDFPRMDPQFISANITPTFAEFVAPFDLWESGNDQFSTDSVKWVLEPAREALGFATLNDTVSRGIIDLPQPTASFIPETFRVIHGPLTLVSDANGNLSGDGSGTFNAQTGEFVARFNQYFSLEVNAFCDIQYDAGDVVFIQSNTFNVPFDFTIPQTLATGDSIMVQDIVQGAFYMGLRGRQGFGGNNYGGVWMTRSVFDFNTPRVAWWHILDVGVGNTVTCLKASDDGEYLWVGVSTGQVFRIGNLNQARSRTTADVDNANPNRVTTIDMVGSWAGRRITEIAVDPNNNDRVMVMLGNYGNSTHVFVSNNATSASPTFLSKQGNLPDMPVYGGIFNYFNGDQVVIGTEFGAFSTDNINAPNPVWTVENSGFANVPVFMVKQGYTRRNSFEGDTLYSGYIDLATHGRGFVRSTSLQQMNPIGVREEGDLTGQSNNLPSLLIYPNPTRDFAQVEVESSTRGNVHIELRDLSGRVVREWNHMIARPGTEQVEIDLSSLPAGVYIARAEAAGFRRSARVIKR